MNITTGCILFAGVMALSLTHGAIAEPKSFAPESQAMKLSRALNDKDVIIGVYDYPDYAERGPDWYKLQDGTSVTEYLMNGLSGSRGWHAMRLLQPIKGETDDLVLFKENAGFGHKINFLPLHGSRWILFLSPLKANDGSLRPYSNYYTDEDIKGILNAKPNIVYELYERGYGALCVNWPKQHNPGSTIIHSEELIDDLVDISAALSMQRRNGDVQSSLILKTILGSEIAAINNLADIEPKVLEP